MDLLSTESGRKYVVYNGLRWYQHANSYFFCVRPKDSDNVYCRSLHRQVWFDNFGEIPKGYHIHHKDRNPANNEIANLEMVYWREHLSNHGKNHVEEQIKKFQKAGQESARKWHKSKEGIEWHRQHAIKCDFGHKTHGEKECDNCGKVFTKGNAFSRFCSNNCKSAWRRKNNPDLKMANCEKCGKEFQTLKYLPRRFCSAACKPAPNPKGNRSNLKNHK